MVSWSHTLCQSQYNRLLQHIGHHRIRRNNLKQNLNSAPRKRQPGSHSKSSCPIKRSNKNADNASGYKGLNGRENHIDRHDPNKAGNLAMHETCPDAGAGVEGAEKY